MSVHEVLERTDVGVGVEETEEGIECLAVFWDVHGRRESRLVVVSGAIVIRGTVVVTGDGGLWEGEHALEEGGRKDEDASEDTKVDVVGCVEDEVGIYVVEGGLSNHDWGSSVVRHGLGMVGRKKEWLQ